jgi:hypothetical protein
VSKVNGPLAGHARFWLSIVPRFSSHQKGDKEGSSSILGGTNDLYLYPDAATVDNITTMAERASAAGATVILGMTMPTNNWGLMQYHGARGNAAIKLWDADLRRLARAYGCFAVDLLQFAKTFVFMVSVKQNQRF